jgi:hypothetical protein
MCGFVVSAEGHFVTPATAGPAGWTATTEAGSGCAVTWICKANHGARIGVGETATFSIGLAAPTWECDGNGAATQCLSFRADSTTSASIYWDKVDPSGEIMTPPGFALPMYEPLRGLSDDLLVLSLGPVPNNSIAILGTNPHLAGLYIVGLNHEFERELLWGEYPTDQRGSRFRQSSYPVWAFVARSVPAGIDAPRHVRFCLLLAWSVAQSI